jgi:hypothetical protein
MIKFYIISVIRSEEGVGNESKYIWIDSSSWLQRIKKYHCMLADVQDLIPSLNNNG